MNLLRMRLKMLLKVTTKQFPSSLKIHYNQISLRKGKNKQFSTQKIMQYIVLGNTENKK